MPGPSDHVGEGLAAFLTGHPAPAGTEVLHWPEDSPTQGPVTQSPATQSPATQSPATQSPATQSPATQSPATQYQPTPGQPAMSHLTLSHLTLSHLTLSHLTLGELTAAAARLADALGDVAGYPVACVVDGGASALTAMFATWLAGGVFLPVSARLPDPELAAYLRHPCPAVVISPAGHEARIPAGLPCLVEHEPRRWTPAGPAASPCGEPLPPGTALVMRTSGTTGTAKPVLLRHAGVRDGIDTVIAQLRGRAKPSPAAAPSPAATPSPATATPDPPMPNLVPVSLALWAGLWNALFAFRVGAPAVLLDRFDPAQFALLVQKFSIRSTILAPAMMTMLGDSPDVTSLAPLRYVRSITAPLTPGQARRFRDRFGVQVLNCYGQTELGGEVVGWTAADLREFGDRKLGAVGRPHAGVTVRVLGQDVSQEAGELPSGQIGEIWIRSPFAAGQALQAPQTPQASQTHQLTQAPQTAPTVPAPTVPAPAVPAPAVPAPAVPAPAVPAAADGFLRTGDLGRLDDDGFLWIEGRTSDVINRGGLKILPQEVEETLRRHPQIADACVAGVPDERLGEVPVAWIRALPGTRPEENDLRAFTRQALAAYKVPVAVRLVEDFPRNEIGKVLRRELAAGWEARQ
jgi:acyl-CoA synthetase (AMP-forming)/AMP-acid ligase II